ncbi:MAG: hypothetical protein LBP53_00930 [Candidatus Peribacteria bacterium]|jgi:hypothetical protein|nr:hypothetical protein [Candidatus Peribacteria bacterium]
MELITTLKTGVEDISNFPIIQAEKSDNFQQRYKKELKKLENKYQNMLSI